VNIKTLPSSSTGIQNDKTEQKEPYTNSAKITIENKNKPNISIKHFNGQRNKK
jgi:hypothetical protein